MVALLDIQVVIHSLHKIEGSFTAKEHTFTLSRPQPDAKVVLAQLMTQPHMAICGSSVAKCSAILAIAGLRPS